MKSVILSIQPKWCELIASGRKTIEVRKTRPQIDTPFKCYIYCTASDVHSCLLVGNGSTELFHCCNYKTAFISGGVVGNGKVIGEFVCDSIEEFHEWQLSPQGKFQECEENDLKRFLSESCLSWEEVYAYRQNLPYYKPLYGLHISALKIYDKPKELGEFKREGFMTEEQWLYALYPNTHCHYEAWAKRFELTRPPQSWCYCEVSE